MDEDAKRWNRLGLFEPDVEGAEIRLALLRYLSARGATDNDLAGNAANLPPLVTELRLRRPRLSLGQVSDRSGMAIEVGEQIARAAGFVVSPDQPLFTERDVEVFELAQVAVDMFGLEPTLQSARVIAGALAQIADTAMTNFGQNIGPALTAQHASELAMAEATDAANALLFDGLPTVLAALFFHACEDAIRRTATSGASATSDLTVGFLDLVGSTALAQHLGAEALGVLMSGFERHAAEVVASADGRVVKMIGDEVMFVTSSALSACTVALDLVEWVDAHPGLPRLRGALAAGHLVRGYGDYYGPVVSTAARAVKLAEPGTILTTSQVREKSESENVRFEPVGERALRGLDRPVALFLLRR